MSRKVTIYVHAPDYIVVQMASNKLHVHRSEDGVLTIVDDTRDTITYAPPTYTIGDMIRDHGPTRNKIVLTQLTVNFSQYTGDEAPPA